MTVITKTGATPRIFLPCYSYEIAGNQGRLYEEEAALLEAFDFDMDIAAAALLARDAAALARGSEAVTTQIAAILADERVFRLLCEHMAFGDRQAVPGDSMDPRRVHARMEAFRAEFLISLEMKPSLPGAA
jgi:predicted nucleotidyltransferase